MTTYVKIVKGATKIKVAAPKPKYIEPILIATADNGEFKTVMKALYDRLGDQAWSIVFKALLVIHIMIREGEKDITLRYLAKHPEYFSLSQMKQGNQAETKSLLRYGKYLAVRAKEFKSTKIDYVRDEQDNSTRNATRLRTLSVDKGLLREVESVEAQIESLLHCKFLEAEINNDIVLTCFRMLVNDLLNLFQALNEGVINILEHYFEMSKYDAKRALEIYKDFVVLTTDVVNYLRVAKHLEYATKLHVPTIRHAPTALAKSLEEYLNDTNFEANRNQYLSEQSEPSNSTPTQKAPTQSIQQKPTQSIQQQQIQPQVQPQQQLPQQLAQQPTAMVNPWANQIQVQFTQAQAQPQPQAQIQPYLQQMPTYQQHQLPVQNNSVAPQLIPQSTNPFLQTQQPLQQTSTFATPSLPQQQTQQLQPLQSFKTGDFSSVPTSSLQPTFTGAGFGNGALHQQITGSNPFLSSLPLQSQQQPQVTKPLESTKTGNNPFALNYQTKLSTVQETGSTNPFSIQNTGSTNPFASNNIQANSAQTFSSSQNNNGNTFATPTAPLNVQSTGTNPFQSSYTSNRISIQQPTFGGFERLPTHPVFPQTIQEQKTLQFNQQAGYELQQQINHNKMQQQFGQLQVQPQQQHTGIYNGPSLI